MKYGTVWEGVCVCVWNHVIEDTLCSRLNSKPQLCVCVFVNSRCTQTDRQVCVKGVSNTVISISTWNFILTPPHINNIHRDCRLSDTKAGFLSCRKLICIHSFHSVILLNNTICCWNICWKFQSFWLKNKHTRAFQLWKFSELF